MTVKIVNTFLNDSIEFEIDELNDESRQMVLDEVHKRGWKDNDCYSEVSE